VILSLDCQRLVIDEPARAGELAHAWISPLPQ
jgi:hypothetical protein